MKKLISCIIFSFMLIGCGTNVDEQSMSEVSEKEVVENYLLIKKGIGNYMANTSFSDNESGQASKNNYVDGIEALEGMNFLIENDNNLSEEVIEALIEINNKLIEYCEARYNNDLTNNSYYTSIGLENELREKLEIE